MPNINVNISDQSKRWLDLLCAYFQTSQATVIEASLVALIGNDEKLNRFIDAGMKGKEIDEQRRS